MTTMGLEYLKLQETIRANQARESETVRHNVTSETLDSAGIGESIRSHKADEGIRSVSLDETRRSNIARELETNRSNRAREGIALSELDESIRANRARERENLRTNLAREQENVRSNRAQEDIAVYRTDMGVFENVAPLTALNNTRTEFGSVMNRTSTFSERLGNTLLSLLNPFTQAGSRKFAG